MLPPKAVPLAESLKDTIARVEPYFVGEIAPQIAQGKRVLIAAHGNSLRALVKYLDDISDDEIPKVEIPTGVPLVRSEEHTSELQSLMRTSNAVFCLKKKNKNKTSNISNNKNNMLTYDNI